MEEIIQKHCDQLHKEKGHSSYAIQSKDIADIEWVNGRGYPSHCYDILQNGRNYTEEL